MLTFSELLSKLQESHISLLDYSDSNSIEYVRISTVIPDSPEPHTIYIAADPDLILWEGPSSAVIYTASSQVNHPANINWAILKASVDELLHKTTAILENSLLQNQLQLRFNQLLFKNSSIHSLLCLAAEYLGNPVYFQDPASKVLGASDMKRLQEIDDLALHETISTGYTPSENYAKYGFSQISRSIYSSNVPILMSTGFASQHRRYLMYVKYRDVILGHITVIEVDRPFQEQDPEILCLLSKVLALELQKRDYQPPAVNISHSILSDLLEENFRTIEEFLQRISLINWRPAEHLYCIAIRTDDLHTLDNTSYDARLESILSYLFQLFRNQMMMLYHGSILMLVDADKYPSIKESLTYFLKEHHLLAGVSRNFSNILELKHYFNQAVNTLQIGVRLNLPASIFEHNDLYVYDLLTLAEKENCLKDYCSAKIMNVIQQDLKNNTEYYKTTYEYLLLGRSLAAAAQKLFIHRNTVKYRVDQFCQLTGLDLSNPETILQILLTNKCLQLLHVNF